MTREGHMVRKRQQEDDTGLASTARGQKKDTRTKGHECAQRRKGGNTRKTYEKMRKVISISKQVKAVWPSSG